MKKLKKAAYLALAGVMTASFAGCGGNSGDSASSNSSSASSSGTSSEAKVDTSEFQEITMVTMGNKPTNGRMEAVMEKVNEILKQKVNASLKLQYVEWNDWQTQYNLLLASGDSSLDLIGTATDWLDAWPNAKKGSFLALSEDMLKTYAPQTWASVPAEHWEQCKYDGQIYFIPEDSYTQWTNHGMFYRGDWAKEAGLDKVASFDDLEKYFDGILKNHPGVIPWDAAGSTNLGGLVEGYINAYTKYILINGTTTGLFNLFYVDPSDPYTVLSPYMEGTTLEDCAVMMKRWADKGFWREDVLNYTGETRDLFYAGQSGADQHHTQTFVSTIRPTMDEKQPGSEAQMFPWSAQSKNLVKTVVTHGAMAIGFNSKHAERALMVYDLIRNDQELYRLFNYGIEGEDYIITSDGKLDRPEGYDGTKDGLGINFWWGRTDKNELTDANWYDGKDEIYKEYDSYAIEYPLGKFVFDPANVSTQISALADVCATYMPKIAWGKNDDPKAEVANFRKALKDAGFDDVLKEIQNQLTQVKGQ